MRSFTPLIFTVVAILSCIALGVTSESLNTENQARLIDLLRNAQKSNGDYPNVAVAHHAIAGLYALKSSVSNPQGACAYLSKFAASSEANTINIYDAAAGSVLLNCKITLPAKLRSDLEALISSTLSSPDANALHRAIATLLDTGATVDTASAVLRVRESIKEDDHESFGHAFAALARLAAHGADKHSLNKDLDSFEDVLQQAEETERLLFLASGIAPTSLVLRGAFALGAALNKAPPVKPAQVSKLAQYFLNAAHTSDVNDAFHVITALYTLAHNPFHVPLIISPVQNRVSKQQPSLSVSVTNTLGQAVSPATVNVVSVARLGSTTNLLTGSKHPLAQQASSEHLYSVGFTSLSSQLTPGAYTVEVSAVPSNAAKKDHMIAAVPIKFTVSYVVSVTVTEASVSIVDTTSSATGKALPVDYPAGLGNKKISADFLQKVVIRFNVKNTANNEPFTAHQAFLRVSSASTGAEYFAIADLTSTKSYQVVVDVSSLAEAFNAQTGDYNLALIIGDAAIESSINWTLGSITLSFPDNYKPPQPKKFVSTVGGTAEDFAPKKEIHHIFRQPEKRPPAIVSTVFLGLLGIPVFILLTLWGKLGVNLSLLSFAPTSLVFHGGIAAILGVLALFFLHLTFFTTLQYLAVLGLITATAGNYALSALAVRRSTP